MHDGNQCYVDEVAALQRAIEAKDSLLRERQAAFDCLESRLNSALNELRAQLNEKQTLVDQSECKTQQSEAHASEILEQKTRLELLQKQTERLLSAQAEQIRAGVRAEIEALESRLIDKDSELQSCHACAKEAELRHAAELMGLQRRLAEMQLLNETRNLQIADLKAENARLSQQIASTSSGAGCGQADEIKTLRQDLEEKHLLLASRNEELMRVKAEMDVLQDRVSELESSAKRIEESAETEGAKMRAEFQAQLAFLQAELSQKEWALEERQGALKALEKRFRAKIDELEIELAQRKSPIEHPAQDFVLGDSSEPESRLDRTWKLQERLDADCSESVQPTSNHHSRKWRDSSDWKRRWRSR
jgi:myosin heavy subunit